MFSTKANWSGVIAQEFSFYSLLFSLSAKRCLQFVDDCHLHCSNNLLQLTKAYSSLPTVPSPHRYRYCYRYNCLYSTILASLACVSCLLKPWRQLITALVVYLEHLVVYFMFLVHCPVPFNYRLKLFEALKARQRIPSLQHIVYVNCWDHLFAHHSIIERRNAHIAVHPTTNPLFVSLIYLSM